MHAIAFLWHQCIEASSRNYAINITFFEKINREEIYQNIELVIESLSITPAQLIDEFANRSVENKKLAFKRAMRAKPIICLSSGISIISDFTYLIEDFISKGILFILKKGLVQEGANDNVFGDHGYCFEQYLGELLRQRHIANRIRFCKSNSGLATTYIYPILIVDAQYVAYAEFLLKDKLREQLDVETSKSNKDVTTCPLIVIPISALELLRVDVDLFDVIKIYLSFKPRDNIGSNFYEFISSPYYQNKYGKFTSRKTLKRFLSLLKIYEDIFSTH